VEPTTVSEAAASEQEKAPTHPRQRLLARGRTVAAALSSLWLWQSSIARAAPKEVAVAIEGCGEAEVPTARLFELLRTEVSPATLIQGNASSNALVAGTIELCQGSPHLVRILLSDGLQPPLERVVDLSDVAGELRARTLAVAFGELLNMLSARTAPATAPVTPAAEFPLDDDHVGRGLSAAGQAARPRIGSTPPAAAKSVLDSPTSNANAWRIGAGVSLRQYLQPSTTLAGPWLSIERERWRAEASWLQASSRVPAGTVSLHNLNLAAAWTPWQTGRRLRVSLSVRCEVGITWAVGSPSANVDAVGRTRRKEQLAMLVEPRVEAALSRAMLLEARLAAGAARGLTATANQVPRATSDGPLIGAALGLAISF
jgi:hypothetical protein